MRNKIVSTSLQLVWFSFVFLSFFSIIEASTNEKWQKNDFEKTLSFYPDEIVLEEFTDGEFVSQNCDDANIYSRKLQYTARKVKSKEKSKVKTSYSEKIKPYRLPSNHPAKKTLDSIFTKFQPTKNLDALAAAGFITVSIRPFSFAVIAQHPDLPGYLQKLYVDSERRKKNGKEGWEWLVQRCEGADNIRKLIKEENIRYFSVPDKWIYDLPISSKQTGQTTEQRCILLVTDMELVSQEESHEAWRYIITEEHLDELYIILSHGFASSHVGWNIPYSKSGKFSCIDTEYPKRKPNYVEVEDYLSDEMKAYWKKLIRNGEKKK